MKQTLKDIIEEGKQDSQDNCYKGLFWDFNTEVFLRWNELNKKERK